jgi:hypothetical protein
VTRLCVLAITAIVGLAALAINADAMTDPLSDCKGHGGQLSRPHRAQALRHAYAQIPPEFRVASDCGQAVASQLAIRGPHGRPRVADVFGDCVRHGGRLTRRFDVRTLKRAARNLTPHLLEGTRCRLGISSQLLALGAEASVDAPMRQPSDLDHAAAADVQRAIATITSVVRRAREPNDALPAMASRFLASRPSIGFLPEESRRVGTIRARTWLVTATGSVCVIRQFAQAAVAAGCGRASAFLSGIPILTIGSRSDYRHNYYGVAPDTFATPALLYSVEARRRLTTVENGFAVVSPRLAVSMTWIDAAHDRRWIDSSFVPCAPRTGHCIRMPHIAR